jgi:hypothetical protein
MKLEFAENPKNMFHPLFRNMRRSAEPLDYIVSNYWFQDPRYVDSALGLALFF